MNKKCIGIDQKQLVEMTCQHRIFNSPARAVPLNMDLSYLESKARRAIPVNQVEMHLFNVRVTEIGIRQTGLANQLKKFEMLVVVVICYGLERRTTWSTNYSRPKYCSSLGKAMTFQVEG